MNKSTKAVQPMNATSGWEGVAINRKNAAAANVRRRRFECRTKAVFAAMRPNLLRHLSFATEFVHAA
ncbi:hypothetical protein MB02_03130 [Croceicoccus estronivorus]|nr:hypothetical protein MB02_03130 [Croceicoccus estronivorus]